MQRKALKRTAPGCLVIISYPNGTLGRSPQGGISKSSVRPRLQERCCPAAGVTGRARLHKWRPNYGPDHRSLIKPKNSLIAGFYSLLGYKKYPVRSGRELAPKPLNMLRKFTPLPALHPAAERNSLYFPG
jgi:hypothetical protein